MLPQPRNRLDKAFRAIVDDIYAILTSRMTESPAAQSRGQTSPVRPLPQATVNQIMGLLETLAAPPYNGQADLAGIATTLALAINKLFPVAESLHLLEFAQLNEGTIRLTAAGHLVAQAGTEERKPAPRSASGCSKSISCASCHSSATFARCSTSARIIRLPERDSNWNFRITSCYELAGLGRNPRACAHAPSYIGLPSLHRSR